LDDALPTLRPGGIVVMDNLSSHKNDRTLALFEKMGATVCFPPASSPDLNPIEKMWSKVKQCLRSTEARTVETLTVVVANALHRHAP